MHHNLIIKDGDATKVEKEILVDGVQFVDSKPREGSFNPVTSDGVAKALSVGEDGESIGDVVPPDTSTENQLVNEKGVQDTIDEAMSAISTGYIPKGTASVSAINALTEQQNGDMYVVSDSGTISDGNVTVNAGESVAWDASNSVWYKVNQYALEKYGTNEIRNLPDKNEGYLALNDTNGTGKFDIEKIFNNFAPKFSPTVQCTAGKYYWYNGELLRCTTTYTGAFDASKFTLGRVSEGTGLQVYGSDDLPSSLNDCLGNATYICLNNSVGGNVSNRPDDSTQFFVCTINSAVANVKTQYYFGFSSYDRQFVRNCRAGTWSAWKCTTVSVVQPFSTASTYLAGQRVEHLGELYVALSNISAGAWNSSKWRNLGSLGSITICGGSSDIPSDLNDCLPNTFYSCTDSTTGASIANRATTATSFTVCTLGGVNPSLKTQFFIPSTSDTIYIRNRINSGWTAWFNVRQEIVRRFSPVKTYITGTVVEYGGSVYKAKESVPIGAWDSSKWLPISDLSSLIVCGGSSDVPDDLNDCLQNTNYTCTDATEGASIAHKPTTTDTTFTVVTIGGINGTCKIQFFAPGGSSKIWFRNCWANNWTPWVDLVEAAESGNESQNILAAFDNVVCIGDSLTYSQVFTNPSYGRQAYRPYPKVLSKLCGYDSYTIYAEGGDTCIANWTRYKETIQAKTNALAILYLGTNQGLTDTLSVDAPANADPSTWDDTTNTGCYALWLNKLKTLGYKILLIKPWAGGGADLTTTQSVIDQAASRFGCAVCGPFHSELMKYHYYPDLSGDNHLHYNDLGYAWFASELINQVAKLPSDVAKCLIPQ